MGGEFVCDCVVVDVGAAVGEERRGLEGTACTVGGRGGWGVGVTCECLNVFC